MKCCGSQLCLLADPGVVKRQVSWRLSPTLGEGKKRDPKNKVDKQTNKELQIHVSQGQMTVGITLEWIYSWHPLSCERDILFPLDATNTNHSYMGLKINGLCWYNFNYK